VARSKSTRHEFGSGQRRFALTRVYLKMVCPDIDLSTRAKLADSILALIDGEGRSTPKRGISDPQVVEMVWRNMQCINRRCPMLLFGNQLAAEINEFFAEEE